ncbi:MAG: hypothetical protein GY765_12155 [bacterium]|nr:hypothetical protein [bacterium]
MANEENENRLPTVDDVTPAAIHKKVLSEATQHPTTLLPAAAAILSGAYMGLVDFSEVSFAVALGSAVISLASWVYHYFVRGEQIGVDYVNGIQEKYREQKERHVENVEEKCREARFHVGEQAAKELKNAYIRLDDFLREKSGKRISSTVARFSNLSEECYYQGVHFINKALALFQILQEMDGEKLREEMISWEDALEDMENDKSRDADQRKFLMEALQEKIRKHKKRVGLYSERKETMEEALAQTESLEATLDSTYLEVVDLIDSGTQIQRGNVATNLEKAVDAARRAENRIRGMERGPSEKDDEMYAEAGRQAEKE